MNKRSIFWLVFWLTAVTMRLIDLAAVSLWYDEIFTYRLAHLPLNDLLMATTADVHPPVYYFLIWLVYQLWPAAPDWAARLPSLLASLGSLYLFWQVLKDYALPDLVKYAALVMLGIMPFQIHYAIEARMYALLQFEFLFGVLMVQRRNWPGLALAMVALAYTQNYGLFYDALLFGLAVIRRPADFKPVLLASLTAALFYIPWLPSLLFQLSWAKIYGHWIQPVTFGSVVYALQNLFGGYYVAKPFGLTLPILIMVALFAGLLAGRKYKAAAEINLLAWGALGLAVLVSVINSPILLFRPLIASTPFLYTLAVIPLEKLIKQRWQTIAVIVLFAPTLISSIYGFYSFFAINGKEDLTGMQVVDYLTEHARPGDTVLAISDGPLVLLNMYAPHLDTVKLDVPRECEPLGALSDVARAYMGYTERPFNALPAGRVWVAYNKTVMSKDCEIALADSIVASAEPVKVFQDDKLVFVGLWEIYR